MEQTHHPSIYLPCQCRCRAVAGGDPYARNHAFHGSPTVSAIKQQQHQQQHLATQPPSRIRLPRAGKEGHATQTNPHCKEAHYERTRAKSPKDRIESQGGYRNILTDLWENNPTFKMY